MSFVAAARTTFRSNAVVRGSSSRLYNGVKAKPSGTSFGVPTKKPISPRVFRSLVEMSSISIVLMLPFHITVLLRCSLQCSLFILDGHWKAEKSAFEETDKKGKDEAEKPINEGCETTSHML